MFLVILYLRSCINRNRCFLPSQKPFLVTSFVAFHAPIRYFLENIRNHNKSVSKSCRFSDKMSRFLY